jgi:hypothetical protein
MDLNFQKLSHKHDCLKDSILINESDGNSLQLKYYDCKIKVKYLVYLNFPVFATGVRIFRASNDVGPLFLGPGFTRILEINTR